MGGGGGQRCAHARLCLRRARLPAPRAPSVGHNTVFMGNGVPEHWVCLGTAPGSARRTVGGGGGGGCLTPSWIAVWLRLLAPRHLPLSFRRPLSLRRQQRPLAVPPQMPLIYRSLPIPTSCTPFLSFGALCQQAQGVGGSAMRRRTPLPG